MDINEINKHRRNMGLPEHEINPRIPFGKPGRNASKPESSNVQELSKDTVFPSTRALLEAGISCRKPGGGWSIYWVEMGTELTLYTGSEGPQEASSIDEIIDWIGGDQECVLTPASLRRFGVK